MIRIGLLALLLVCIVALLGCVAFVVLFGHEAPSERRVLELGNAVCRDLEKARGP